MGWANHRANRLFDLAMLTFRFCEASTFVQGVEGIFGCTARQARYADTTEQKKFRGGIPRNNFKEYKIKINILQDRKEPKIKRYNTKKEIPLK